MEYKIGIEKHSTVDLYSLLEDYDGDEWYDNNPPFCIDTIFYELLKRKELGDLYLQDKELTL